MSASLSADLSGRRILVANPSADMYGSDRMMLEAVRGLRDRASHLVVTFTADGPLRAQLEDLGIDVRVLPAPVVRKSMLSPRGFLDLFRAVATNIPKMRRLIQEVDADVVIANTLTIPFWTLAARSCRRPVVVYVHEAESSLSAPARLLLTTPLSGASGAVFNSETSRTVCNSRSLERRGRVRVVHNGVAGPPQSSPPRARIDGRLRIVYVGRLSPRKGVDILVDAVGVLRSQGILAEVDLVGDVFTGYEWYTESLRERIDELDLGSSIHFRGFQEHVWSAINAADIMVVPSRGDESFGNVVVEGLLCARPVIVADHTGLREVASGFSSVCPVPTDSPEALARAVEGLLRTWDATREAAQRDAESARERFAPSRFHAEFAHAVASLT